MAKKELVILGFMTFALVVGDIFPPVIGLQVVAGGGFMDGSLYLPCVLTSLVIGCIESLVPPAAMPGFIKNIPLSGEKLAWVLPTLCVGTVCFAIIGFRAIKLKVSEQKFC